MLDIALKVFFVLIAIVMVIMILLQQGSGAQAGTGFGSGASGTVFGSQGSSNFLSKSTRTLAIAFFALSLFMAWKAKHDNVVPTGSGVMSQEEAAKKLTPSTVPQVPSIVPTPGSVPAGQAPTPPAVIPAGPSTVPATPTTVPVTPVVPEEKPADSASKGG
jgi:preprotein translocase subunit SecG